MWRNFSSTLLLTLGLTSCNLKLQKLVYYAQAWHLALRDVPLFEEDFEAWVHGPVIPALYQEYKKFGWRPILEGSRKT